MTLYKVFGRNSARNRFLVVSGSFYAYTIDAYPFVVGTVEQGRTLSLQVLFYFLSHVDTSN